MTSETVFAIIGELIVGLAALTLIVVAISLFPDSRRNIQAVRPGMEIFKTSAKTGEGMNEYLEFIERRRILSRAAATV